MKFLIIAVCIFVVANGQLEKLKEHFNQMLEECKDIVGASDADVDQYQHRITPASYAGKCMIACVNKKISVQDENGKINPDGAKEAEHMIQDLDEKLHSTLMDIHDKCIDEVHDGPNECDTAARWFTCFSKGTIDAGLPLMLVDE